MFMHMFIKSRPINPHASQSHGPVNPCVYKNKPVDVFAGSPSRGGDVTVYILDINQPSLPTLIILFLCLILSLWLFQLYFIP